jgi:beta-barrel assembly-enhancing protease
MLNGGYMARLQTFFAGNDMKKSLVQFFLFLLLFFSTWYLLSRINWVKLLRIEQITAATEEKAGKLFWDAFSKNENEIDSPEVSHSLDSLLIPLFEKNGIKRQSLKIHLLRNKEVNAFALPGNHLVIFTGLVSGCKNESEFLGVVGHEMAHLKKGHVMKKLVKEAGLSLVFSFFSGSSGGEVVLRTAKMLSSTAYDRKMEREADLGAVDFMQKAGINPKPFAAFLCRLSSTESYLPEQFYWISTHPDSKERTVDILRYIKGSPEVTTPLIMQTRWKQFREALQK